MKDFRANWKIDSANDTAGSEDENENTLDIKNEEDDDGTRLTICENENEPEKKMKIEDDKSKKLVSFFAHAQKSTKKLVNWSKKFDKLTIKLAK